MGNNSFKYMILAVTFALTGCAVDGNSKVDSSIEATGEINNITSNDDGTININSPSFYTGEYGSNSVHFAEDDRGYYYSAEKLFQVYDDYYKDYSNIDGQYIVYYDKGTDISIPLCNRADCEHNTDKCIAYIGYLFVQSICEEGDYIYYMTSEMEYSDEAKELIERYNFGESAEAIGIDKVNYNENIYLCRMKKDGTQKDRLKLIDTIVNTFYFFTEEEIADHKYNTTEWREISNVIAMNGKIYYAYSLSDNYYLKAFDIQNEQITELIAVKEENLIQKLVIRKSGDYIWLQCQKNGESANNADIYAYNEKTNEKKLIIESIKDSRGYGMMADGSHMYYSSEGQMWIIDYDSCEKKVLCSYKDSSKTYYSPIPYKDYLIVSRMDCIEVYDRNGEYIKTIYFDDWDISEGGGINKPYAAVQGINEQGDMFVLYNSYSSGFINFELYKVNFEKALEGNIEYILIHE